MIRIDNKVIKQQPQFWNHALFHPTDAVEDPWGKRILDRMSQDGAIKTIRIYTMFEDIVYLDENGKLMYDFRVSDLRIDYLLEKGYDLLLAYGGIPDCIASGNSKTSSAKNKTRYKGKMWNTTPPKDYALWEEICYEYTKHNIERYGIDTVSSWYCHCFNEPDIRAFWFADQPDTTEAVKEYRLPAYCKLYEAFERGVRRASERVRIGGPALAGRSELLTGFLTFVKEKGLRLDYIALHNYGTRPGELNDGTRPLAVENHFEKHENYMKIIRECGFDDIEIVLDEWGAATMGFYNVEECPSFIFRENEVYSAYFVKLICKLIEAGYNISKMMICLSGQHEMVTDFSGFRNFFTLNFITKPIYNAHLMSSKLGDQLIANSADDKNVFAVSTKNDKGELAVLLTYCSEHFEEDLPEIEEKVIFADDISKRTVTLYCIDKTTTNPYRMWERAGMPEMDEELLKTLRTEGKLKAVRIQKGSEEIKLKLIPNASYLITVTD